MIEEFFIWLKEFNIEYYNECKSIYDTKPLDDPFHDHDIITESGESGTLIDTGLKDILISDIITSDHFIETGTHIGYLIKELSQYGTSSYSCETSLWRYCMAEFNLRNTENVSLYHMDSGEFLKEREITDDSVLFLDAHGGGYDDWNDNPLIHELKVIASKNVKPTIYIHDFAIETFEGDSTGFKEAGFDKTYKYRFDFNSENGWKLDWDFIKTNVELVFGDDYTLSFPDEYPSTHRDVGWIRITKLV